MSKGNQRAAPSAIDLRRYPIDDLATPAGRALIDDCRARMAEEGICLLPGFLTEEATTRIADEALAGGRTAHRMHHHFPFGDGTLADSPNLEGLAEDDPRRFRSRAALQFVAYDEIPLNSPMREVYEWDGLRAFVAATLGRRQLYGAEDSLGSLNYTVMSAGDEQAWHFDDNHFTVTILLQKAESGGCFEFVPGLRGATGDDIPGLRKALAGTHERLRRIAAEPGTLVLFEGRTAFHRATPVEGTRKRLLAVLSYEEEPWSEDDTYLSRLFYGRTAPRTPPATLAELEALATRSARASG